MEKRLRSSLATSPQSFLSTLTDIPFTKSTKPTLKSLISSIPNSSPLSTSLPLSLHHSISHLISLLQNPQPNSPSPITPPPKRPRRSSRLSGPPPIDSINATKPQTSEDLNTRILKKLQCLAYVVALCVGSPSGSFSVNDLLPSVKLLHDSLGLFELDVGLSSEVANLCEVWWKEGLLEREGLISQLLPFLLSQSLTLKKKVDVRRVYGLREGFSLFDYEDESIEDLKMLLMRCVISPVFLKTEEGRRFVAFMFGLSKQLGKEAMAMIRSQIHYGRKSMLEAYGDILFRAWKSGEGDLRGEIEDGFLQGLIEGTIHASSAVFAAAIRRVLGGFISQRTVDGVEKVLFRLSEPVIFRSLQVRIVYYFILSF